MTAPKECQRDAKFDRRRTGLQNWGWFVYCGCGFYEDRLGKMTAEMLAAAHNDGRAA